MSQTKQSLLAFLIPFSMAVCLQYLRVYVFYDPCDSQGDAISFGVYDCAQLIQSQIISLFAVALLILSFVLPFFVSMRTHQNQRDKSELKLNIE